MQQFERFFDYIYDNSLGLLFHDRIGDLSVIEFIILVTVLFLVYLFIKKIGKWFLSNMTSGAKQMMADTRKVFKKRSISYKADKVHCPTCRKKIVDCSCIHNRDLSLKERYKRYEKKYKLEIKQARLNKKLDTGKKDIEFKSIQKIDIKSNNSKK